MSPAISKKQQRLAAIALHSPEKLYNRNKGMAKMAKSDLRHYAETKRKGLPAKKKSSANPNVFHHISKM